MKKLWIIGVLAALALIVFGVVGFAYAQTRGSNSDSDSPSGTAVYGCGMYGPSNGQRANSGRAGRGMMGGGMMGNRASNPGGANNPDGSNYQDNANCPMADGDENGTQEYGPLHDYMYKAFAQALGITPEELDARRQSGDTLWVIAQEKGLTTEQFQEMMTTARTNAANQAVADGVITQAQADFMLQRMETMMGNGYGPGYGGCINNQP
jgi:hypothetical protein